jgi:hypothetical protein
VVAAVNEVEIEKNEKLASEHLPRNCNQLNTLGLLELHLEKKMIEKY